MQPTKDYYTILGITHTATQAEIKAAFKRLALQYHPDRNKSADANTHMSEILEAYQVLNDPEERKDYDALRKYSTTSTTTTSGVRGTAGPSKSSKQEITPRARRDRQRHYAFPTFRTGETLAVDLGDMNYTLSSKEAQSLVEQGLLRGVAPHRPSDKQFHCHRCHHTWNAHTSGLPTSCPKCHAGDWSEYLLLRCSHCHAIFESEQIRNEIGAYTYSNSRTRNDGLCPPYELFPLCPYCAQAQWCPAENYRVAAMRRHMETQRMLWISIAIVLAVIAGILILGLGR
ncbi:DnaJ domain-containing protein [Ktedonospora formicarum]|uniref:J domain-containing protein n=1 Tax=Ktedonospora formicarum TaxID=2778364 RepID=A0A8J3I3V7_9CHLR|nr:DnaJ domain-containing protein [Ktedonospora formicarum]GHO44974.1 hypothetical protein KSX_31370 [Ktedonospora formicarum]